MFETQPMGQTTVALCLSSQSVCLSICDHLLTIAFLNNKQGSCRHAARDARRWISFPTFSLQKLPVKGLWMLRSRAKRWLPFPLLCNQPAAAIQRYTALHCGSFTSLSWQTARETLPGEGHDIAKSCQHDFRYLIMHSVKYILFWTWCQLTFIIWNPSITKEAGKILSLQSGMSGISQS